jgi:hypothetical protein
VRIDAARSGCGDVLPTSWKRCDHDFLEILIIWLALASHRRRAGRAVDVYIGPITTGKIQNGK